MTRKNHHKKSPAKEDVSLVVNRPRRICRLPSRFEDHSISPSKYIPLQPANASTPIQQSKLRKRVQQSKQEIASKETTKKLEKQTSRTTRSQKTDAQQNKLSKSRHKSSPDTNNKAKSKSTKTKNTKALSPKKVNTNVSTIKRFFNKIDSPQPSTTTKTISKRNKEADKSLSFQVLGGNKNSKKGSLKQDVDIYEFTFDPDEEPQPQKKKRKKLAVNKQPKVTKPKVVVMSKSTYDQNISKALSALKKAIKPSKFANMSQIKETSDNVGESGESQQITSNAASKEKFNKSLNTSAPQNYESIRIEDIAANIEPSMDHHDDINYSPVNSPHHNHPTNVNDNNLKEDQEGLNHNKDPLNLQEDLSFFDDIPVASSSINTSVRHPLASPWRVEFGSLPIKWHSNTYVKPNMTPAVESSFICSEDSNKKKHVYTNMVLDADEPPILKEPNFKQASIISFIKEVAEKKAQKKRERSLSPTKAIAALGNIQTDEHISSAKQVEKNSSCKNVTSNKNASEEVLSSNNVVSNLKEISKKKSKKRKNNENIRDRPTKSPCKLKDKDCTYFGFDESENQDQENMSPVKMIHNDNGRSLRPRLRPVLQELNGPTRAVLPVAVKSKIGTSSEAVYNFYQAQKSAEDAPALPEKNIEDNGTHLEDPDLNEDSQSVHLFEDIDVIHHLKPIRKSYGKAKKVTFCQTSAFDSETQNGVVHNNDSSFEDDFGDLTFEVPNVKEKKKNKKKKPKGLMSKKEAKEAEEWAAGFNSMCEEIEEFPLVVE